MDCQNCCLQMYKYFIVDKRRVCWNCKIALEKSKRINGRGGRKK